MKSLLALLLTIATAPAQWIGDSAPYRGEYFAILIPSPKCSNERLGMEITMNADGELSGQVRNWDNVIFLNFAQAWPFFDNGKFTSDITELGDYVRGSASIKGGTVKGTASIRGCRYTFTAYRRFKVAQ